MPSPHPLLAHSVAAMERAKCIIFFLSVISLFSMFIVVTASGNNCDKSEDPSKLFIFGDSYVDTGNLGKLGQYTRSWYKPYGITFPHRPTGRYSDGRLLTDYLASFMGIKSPIPYKYRRFGSKLLQYGMNFAVAGTGVFDTGDFQRNLSAQIDTFEGQINSGVFTDCDLNTSIALVSIDGNDYIYYMENGGTLKNIEETIHKVIVQLKSDLKRLQDIGVRKMVVSNMHPVGCTPLVTRDSNYSHCDNLFNLAAVAHNLKLDDAIHELRGTGHSQILTLDLHRAFKFVIEQEKGARKFGNTLKPCCEGKRNDTYCGQISEKGINQYSLCPSPEDHFYWDIVHPTQSGWNAVFEFLRPSLYKLFTLF